MIRRPPRSTPLYSSAASDVYKRQMFLNLGDSYSTHAAGKCAAPMATSNLAGVKTQEVARATKEAQPYRNAALPEKNLIGIPWRVALALQADGWTLRSDIIWAKPNPMPESVTDRPTKSHEYVFVLTKSARYFWDAEGVRENWADSRICLLYTSPSPRDRTRSRMPSSA